MKEKAIVEIDNEPISRDQEKIDQLCARIRSEVPEKIKSVIDELFDSYINDLIEAGADVEKDLASVLVAVRDGMMGLVSPDISDTQFVKNIETNLSDENIETFLKELSGDENPKH